MENLKIILSLFVLSVTANCHCQKILPVEKLVDYMRGKQGGLENNGYTYVKDVNNVLDKFIGTWKGKSTIGKTYEIKINEISETSYGIKEDLLILKYRVLDAKGKEIDNTLSLPNDHVYVVSGAYLDKQNNYVFNFNGGQKDCGLDGSLFVKVLGNGKKLEISLHPIGESISVRCESGDPIEIMPVEITILDKK